MTDTAAGRGQHQPPKPGVIKMGLPHEEVLPTTARPAPKRDRCNACGVEWPDEPHRCAVASPMELARYRRVI